MAYQGVGTPRFYVNVIEWLGSIGYYSIPSVFRTLPVLPKFWENEMAGFTAGDLTPPLEVFGGQEAGGAGFVALLGHNLYFRTIWYSVNKGLSGSINADLWGGGLYGERGLPSYDGWSLSHVNLFNHTTWPDFLIEFSNIGAAITGSAIIGTYYTMPHSPDLSLTMSREFGGTKTITTKGGSSLSNTLYTSPPLWGDLGAWELGDTLDLALTGSPPQALRRSGRRIWDLSFSYLDDGDVWGPNQLLNTDVAITNWGGDYRDYDGALGRGDVQFDKTFDYNVVSDHSFFSQVIHKTNGGQLPFIFMPDSNSSSPDNFAIAKMDMNSFKFSQVANGVYNVKLKIREVW